MRARRAAGHCKCNDLIHTLSSSFILLALVLPTSSFAQLISDNGPSSTSLSPALPKSTSIPPTFSTITSAQRLTTSSPPSNSNSTSSTPTGPITRDNAPPLFSGPSSSSSSTDRPTNDRNSGVLNYYFVFLALFGLLLCAGIFFIHRRKKRQKERYRNSGQNALARDLDGWVNTRRWINGGWRTGNAAVSRREEGLNEEGEAPPPYQPKINSSRSEEDGNGAYGSHSGLAVPLRTLSRDHRTPADPPDYQETVHPVIVNGSTPTNAANAPQNRSEAILRSNEALTYPPG